MCPNEHKTVLQLAPMLLQLTRTGGQINILGVVVFHCTTQQLLMIFI